MKLNNINLGTYNALRQFHAKQILGDVLVENGGRIAWRRGGEPSTITVRQWVLAPVVVAGNAAGSQAANEIMVRWLEEIAANEDMQPVYPQWSSVRQLPQDGWWFLTDAVPDYKYTGAGAVPVDLTFVQKAPGGSPIQIAHAGGPNPANAYTLATTNLVALPVNSSGIAASGQRQGSEGNIPYQLSPQQNPVTLMGSATLNDVFTGGVHVYDVNAALSTNPVPQDGTAVHANWVEVFGTDHRYAGDIVVSNGLVLITIQLGVGVTVWEWNSNGSPEAWVAIGSIQSFDSGGLQGSPTQVRFQRLGPEEANLDVVYTNAQATQIRFRLQRGQLVLNVGVRPQTYQNTSPRSVVFVPAVAGNLIAYNSGIVRDQQFVSDQVGLPATSDAGWGAAFLAKSNAPYIVSWLTSPKPAGGQPYLPINGVGVGDSGGPIKGAWAFYGLAVTPFPTTQNLQAEAESGSLGTGWTNATEPLASGGHAAKCASGTVANNFALFGTAWSPPAGTYYAAFRVRVTSAAGAAFEMLLGMFDNTTVGFVPGGSVAVKANQANVNYIYVYTPVFTMPGGHSIQFIADTFATLGTDWFIDEAFLLPVAIPFTASGPQDLWQQWGYERTTTFPVL